MLLLVLSLAVSLVLYSAAVEIGWLLDLHLQHPWELSEGLHLGIHGFFGIFLNLFGIFWIFGQILGFLVKIRSESCRRLRDLQKSIVILSNGAVWTRNVTLLMKTLIP